MLESSQEQPGFVFTATQPGVGGKLASRITILSHPVSTRHGGHAQVRLLTLASCLSFTSATLLESRITPTMKRDGRLGMRWVTCLVLMASLSVSGVKGRVLTCTS